jgi:two-component system, NarL family, invasion response regulator UvrY
MIRVAIAEERTLIRDALANLLTSQGAMEVVGETASVDEAVELARDNKVDVLLVGSASDGGITASRAIAAAGLPTRVLVVGTGRTVSPARLLAAGAAGYIGADTPGRELMTAITRVHGGERVAPSENVGHDPAAVLSPRELETLRFLACGLTNREIATRLGISVKTIDTHRGHVLKKLNLRNNADLTRFAIEHGLCDLDMLESPEVRDDGRQQPAITGAPHGTRPH